MIKLLIEIKEGLPKKRMVEVMVMYERLLDKEKKPDFDELAEYCGENSNRFRQINDFLVNSFSTTSLIRFPYGNNYGWSATHRIGKKLICDIFAESGSFCVMMRLSDQQFNSVYSKLKIHAQECIDKRYPCGNGGWIHYRVKGEDDLKDIELLLEMKCTK